MDNFSNIVDRCNEFIDRKECFKHTLEFNEWLLQYSTIVGNLKVNDLGVNGLLTSRTDKSKDTRGVGRHLKILSDLEPISFDITYSNPDEYDNDNAFLDPYNLEDLKDSVNKDNILKRMKSESAVGGHFGTAQFLMVIRSVIGWKESRNNVILRMLKYYLIHINEKAVNKDVEVYQTARDNYTIYKVSYDTSSPVRLHFAIICALWLSMYSHLIHDEVFIEFFKYIFVSPHSKTAAVAKKISFLRQCMFSMSTKFEFPRWEGSGICEDSKLYKYVFEKMETKTPPDAYFYRFNYENIINTIKELTEMGLPSLAKAFQILIDADVNEYNILTGVILMSFASMTGFTKSDNVIGHMNQVNAVKPEDVVKDPPYKEYLYKVYFDWFVESFKSFGFMSYERFLIRMPSLLTSKSSGGSTVKISVKMDRNVPGTRSNQLDIRSNNKRITTLVNPSFFLDPNNVYKSLTKERPGLVGTRYVVGGKAARAIFMVPTNLYLLQTIFGLPLYFEAFKPQIRDRIHYSVGKDTGNQFIDHTDSFLATTDPSFRYLIFAQDYSAFDAHQKKDNTADIQYRAAVDAMKYLGIADSKWGPYDKVSELARIVYQLDRNIYFYTKNDVREMMLEVDMLLSGKFTTLVDNNLVNTALQKYVYDKFISKGYLNEVNLKGTFIQGDDKLTMYENVGCRYETYESMIKDEVIYSKENGQELNASKTAARVIYSEYLKVFIICGYLLRLHFPQIYSSETEKDTSDPIGFMISYINLINTLCFRGMPRKYGNRIIIYTWNMIRRVNTRITSLEYTNYYLPFSVLFLPKEYKGVGYHEIGPGVSMDYQILYDASQNENYKYELSRSAYIMSKRDSSVVRNIVSKVVKGKYIKAEIDKNDGTKFETFNVFEKGLEYLDKTLVDEVKINARKARQRLINNGAPPLGNMFVEARGEVLINETLATANVFKRIRKQENSSVGESMINCAISDNGVIDIIKPIEWITHMKIILNEIENFEVNSTPIPGLCYGERVVVNLFNISTASDAFRIRPNALLNELRNKSTYFRHDLKNEQILLYLMDPRVNSKVENVKDALIAMGGDPDISSLVAMKIYEIGNQVTANDYIERINFNDSLFAVLDKSQEKRRKLIEFTSTSNQVVDKFIFEFLTMFLITKCIEKGKAYKLKMYYDDAFYTHLNKHLKSKSTDFSFYEYYSMYPRLETHQD